MVYYSGIIIIIIIIIIIVIIHILLVHFSKLSHLKHESIDFFSDIHV
jgi:hypothetical protein